MKKLPVLEVQDVAKTYHIYDHPRDRFMQTFLPMKRQLYRQKRALSPISFSMMPGDVMGIVGRNGSGKSTLLKIIAGMLKPSEGRVVCRGRIGAMELGSGFDPEFSGLDNVFMKAAMLGFTDHDTRERLDEILHFAEIGDSIHQPVKTYSTGMVMRLDFAIQAQTNPDLLIIDEALAVGDEVFQRRCIARLEQLKAQGTAILLVSHSCPTIVQFCNRAMLLHAGRLRMLDSPKQVVRVYQRLSQARSASEWEPLLNRINELRQESLPEDLSGLTQSEPTLAVASLRMIPYEVQGGELIGVQMMDSHGRLSNVFLRGKPLIVELHFRLDQQVENPCIGCNIGNAQGILVTGQKIEWEHESPAIPKVLGAGHWTATFKFKGGLMEGLYFINCYLRAGKLSADLHRIRDAFMFRIVSAGPSSSFGLCDLSGDPPRLTALTPESKPSSFS